MKKLKFILCVGILGVMTYGGITAYNHVTMTEQERLLLANVEALTSGETGAGGCYGTMGYDCYGRGSIDYKCTTSVTGSRCSIYAPGYYCC